MFKKVSKIDRVLKVLCVFVSWEKTFTNTKFLFPLFPFVPTEDEEGDAMLEGDEAPSHFDLIKCGDCQADFALSDIVKFIEHKRKCFRTSNGSITSEDPPTLQLITKDGIKEETDIVSPVAATPTANGTADTRREDAEENEEMETAMSPLPTADIVRTEKPKIITPIKPRRMSSSSSQHGQRDTSSPRVKQTQTEPAQKQGKVYSEG